MRGSLRPFYRLSRAYTSARAHLEALRGINPGILEDDHEGYITDWTNKFSQSVESVVARPSSTYEVSMLLKYCNEHRIAVVPQGGNTGLSGASVGLDDSLVLSMSRMNRIEAVDEVAGILSCEAGCVLQTLQERVQENGFMMPLDLGAKGQCQIGGNIATAAGGLNVIRYGPISRYVLGLEVVLADGTILDCDRKLFKDNMGLKIPMLFNGSEGTLGVITKVSLMLVPKPLFTAVALFTLPSFSALPEVLTAARKELGEILSAFEFMDASSIKLLGEGKPQLLAPFGSAVRLSGHGAVTERGEGISGEGGILGEVSVLIAVSGSSSDAEERLQTFVHGHAHDVENKVILPRNMSQARAVWDLRESVPIALMQLSRLGREKGRLYKYDISLTLQQMTEVVAAVVSRVAESDRVPSLLVEPACFGHCGDLNLHLNVLARPRADVKHEEGSGGIEMELDALQDILDKAVAEEVSCRRGSLSAEHGVGQLKKKYMPLVRGPEELRLMRSIKALFDPNGIMNPTCMLPEEITNIEY